MYHNIIICYIERWGTSLWFLCGCKEEIWTVMYHQHCSPSQSTAATHAAYTHTHTHTQQITQPTLSLCRQWPLSVCTLMQKSQTRTQWVMRTLGLQLSVHHCLCLHALFTCTVKTSARMTVPLICTDYFHLLIYC